MSLTLWVGAVRDDPYTQSLRSIAAWLLDADVPSCWNFRFVPQGAKGSSELLDGNKQPKRDSTSSCERVPGVRTALLAAIRSHSLAVSEPTRSLTELMNRAAESGRK